MDTKLLTFIEVCKTKNYTKAASVLNLTQPAISQHIKQIEQEYNVKLFVKRNNQMTLTREGETILKYALRIQSLYKNLERKVEETKKYANSLTIGITHTSESNDAPENIAIYSNEHPESHIRIISDSITNLYDKLLNYEIDLAIIDGKISNKKLSSISLRTDSLVATVSPDNPLAKKKIISIEELMKEKLILRPIDSATSMLFINELNKKDISSDDLNIILEIDSVASIKNLVRKNMGVSILPRSACTREIKEKTIYALTIENMDLTRETSLVYIDGNIERKILEEIVETYQNNKDSN